MKETDKCSICSGEYTRLIHEPAPAKSNGQGCSSCYYDTVRLEKAFASKNNAIEKLEHLWARYESEEGLVHLALFHWREIFNKGMDDSCWSVNYYELFNLLDFANRPVEAYAATISHWMYMRSEGGFDSRDEPMVGETPWDESTSDEESITFDMPDDNELPF